MYFHFLHPATNCTYQIGSNLIKLGCFRDFETPPRPLPVKLLTEDGLKAYEDENKETWQKFIQSFVCKCAEMTRKKGWFTFGIQNYGKIFPTFYQYAKVTHSSTIKLKWANKCSWKMKMSSKPWLQNHGFNSVRFSRWHLKIIIKILEKRHEK